jgi:hypothetical protein
MKTKMFLGKRKKVHIWKIIPDERFKDFADDLESKMP